MLIGALAALLVSACGGGPSTATSTAAPTVAPTAAPTVPRPSASPSPSPAAQPTATTRPAAANTVYVGNTDGEGVYIRKTPAMADRLQAYPDGTALTVVGDDVDGDDQHWKHVKTPDGLEGYVPSIYTVETPP